MNLDHIATSVSQDIAIHVDSQHASLIKKFLEEDTEQYLKSLAYSPEQLISKAIEGNHFSFFKEMLVKHRNDIEQIDFQIHLRKIISLQRTEMFDTLLDMHPLLEQDVENQKFILQLALKSKNEYVQHKIYRPELYEYMVDCFIDAVKNNDLELTDSILFSPVFDKNNINLCDHCDMDALSYATNNKNMVMVKKICEFAQLNQVELWLDAAFIYANVPLGIGDYINHMISGNSQEHSRIYNREVIDYFLYDLSYQITPYTLQQITEHSSPEYMTELHEIIKKRDLFFSLHQNLEKKSPIGGHKI